MVLTAQGADSLAVDSISVSGRYNFGPIVVDMNRDGSPEIVAFTSTGDGICISVDTSNVQPALSVLERNSTGYTFTTNPVAGDLDLDGRADIVIGGTNTLYAFDEHLTMKSDFPRECGDRNPTVDIIAAPMEATDQKWCARTMSGIFTLSAIAKLPDSRSTGESREPDQLSW
jgi:hypothetical protein